ncbi:MAG: hypothetical protein Q8R79_02840 [Legionellaceae bacterium]|nr:hypothetical protein [Legionellaceae bacterium]
MPAEHKSRLFSSNGRSPQNIVGHWTPRYPSAEELRRLQIILQHLFSHFLNLSISRQGVSPTSFLQPDTKITPNDILKILVTILYACRACIFLYQKDQQMRVFARLLQGYMVYLLEHSARRHNPNNADNVDGNVRVSQELVSLEVTRSMSGSDNLYNRHDWFETMRSAMSGWHDPANLRQWFEIMRSASRWSDPADLRQQVLSNDSRSRFGSGGSNPSYFNTRNARLVMRIQHSREVLQIDAMVLKQKIMIDPAYAEAKAQLLEILQTRPLTLTDLTRFDKEFSNKKDKHFTLLRAEFQPEAGMTPS